MNLYTTLATRPANDHYLKRYVKFIEACNGSTADYIENHHICPKAYFPEYEDLKVNPWNRAKLSARQHFIAHWMLAKAYGGTMWFGLQMMTTGNRMHKREGIKMTSSLYEVVRREKSKSQSERISGEGHHMFGKKHSEETLTKMREVKMGANNPRYGIPNSQEQKLKISQANKGLKRTVEFCQKVTERLLSAPMVSCPHCGKESRSPGNLNRWHFDNCKQKGQ